MTQEIPTDGHVKRVAAVTNVDVGDQTAVYSIVGKVHWSVARDPEPTVTVLEYTGEGVLLDGDDLGAINYRSTEAFSSPIAADGTFIAYGEVAWRADGVLVTVRVRLRGTVLNNDEIAFITSSFSGDDSRDIDLSVQIPACW